MSRGHIRQRSENSWAIILYTGTDAEGKPRQKWHSVKGTREDAERRLTEILRQMDTYTYLDPGKITLADYLHQWQKDYCELNLAQNTLVRYKGIIKNHLIPNLGHHPLVKLQPLHVQSYYTEALKSGRADDKGDKLSPASVRYHHAVLREALNHAVEWQLVFRNVCDAVRPPKLTKAEMVTLTKADIDALLLAAEGTSIFIPVAVAINTGMRRGEVLALHWKDVDLKAEEITIRRSVEWNREEKRHEFKTVKNEKPRRIDITKKLAGTLKAWKAEQSKRKLALGKDYHKSDLVCTQDDGTMVSLDHTTKAFGRLARKCKLDITFHGLRHSHATMLIESGVPSKLVAERLGNDVGIMEKTYAHVTPGMRRELVQKLEDLLG